MAVEVASAYVTIIPSFRGFRKELLREVRAAEKGVRANIAAEVDVHVDRNRVQNALVGAVGSGSAAIFKAGVTAGETLASGVASGIRSPQRLLAIAGALLAVAVQYGPVIGATIGGGIMTGLGGALAGFGIFLAAQNENVKKAYGDLFGWMMERLQGVAQPFVDMLLGIVPTIRQTFSQILPYLEDAFDTIAPALGDFFEYLAEAAEKLAPVLPAIAEAFSAILEELGPELPVIFAGLADAFISLADAIADNPDAFVNFVTGVINAVTVIAQLLGALTRIDQWMREHQGLVDTIAAIFNAIVNPAQNAIDAGNLLIVNWENIKQAFSAAWDWISQKAGEVWGAVVTPIVDGFNWLRDSVTSVVQTVVDWFAKWWPLLLVIFTPIAAAFITVWNRIKGTVFAVWGSITSFLSQTWDTIKTTATNVWNSIKDAMEGPIRRARDTLLSLGQKIKDAITGAFNSAYNSVRGVGSKFTSVGRDIVNGIVRGVRNAGKWLKDALVDLAHQALEAAKDFLGISSPSRVFADVVGTQIPAGIAMGVERNAAVALNAVRSLASGTVSAYAPPSLVTAGGYAPPAAVGGTTVNLYQTDTDPNVLAARLDWILRGKG